ncbi:MAG: outer membrane beta-barrel protein [Prevotella sp.]|nr:outer membrane beta-barrel protein [Prevotella sp.]
MMKQIKFLVIVAALMVCSIASAQFTRSSRSGSSSLNTDGWQSIFIMYSPTTLSTSITQKNVKKQSLDSNLTGLTFGYNKAFSVSKNIPLFVKVGGELKYSYGKENEEIDRVKCDVKYSFFSVKVPTSVVYDISIANNIDILPYAGVYFRYNISHKEKLTLNDDYYYYDSSEKYEMDLFDKINRFQVGWHIGADVMFNRKFYAGVGYSSDITKFCDDDYNYNDDGYDYISYHYKADSHAINITLGFVF